MRRVAEEVFHLATFHQFKPATTERSPSALNKPFYLLYLLASHAAALAIRDIQRAKMENKYAGKSYDEKAHQVQQQFKKMLPALKAGQRMSSAGESTHQFSKHVMKPQLRLDSSFLNKARIDPKGCFVDVDASMTFGDLMRHVHAAGFRVPLVPEFLNITAGGAFVGVAIESSGHKYGLFHEHVLQAEVLMPNGELKTVSLKSDSDIFHALPNSNGTLGRIMRLRLPLIPQKTAFPGRACHPFLDEKRKAAYLAEGEPAWLEHDLARKVDRDWANSDVVHLRYHRFDKLDPALEAFWQSTEAKQADFVEAVMLSADKVVLVVGEVKDCIRHIPDDMRHNYQTRDVFWQHVNNPAMRENFVPLLDYYARWHQTVFWNTQQLGPLTKLMNSPVFRTVLGRHMGPGFLAMLSNAKDMWTHKFHPKPAGLPSKTEHMVQDMGIPKSRLKEFARFYQDNVHLYPVWLCPVKQADGRFPNFTAKAKEPIVDWGMFTGEGKLAIPGQPWFHNNALEEKIAELGGIKALYSDNVFHADSSDAAQRRAGREAFNALYNMERYEVIKARVDPEGVYPHVFEKMVAAQHQTTGKRAPHHTKLPFTFEAFMLWTQSVGVSVVASVVAAYTLRGSSIGGVAMAAVVGGVATQLSRLVAQMMQPRQGMEPIAMARGVSAGVTLAVLLPVLAILRAGLASPARTLLTLLVGGATAALLAQRMEVSNPQRHRAAAP